MVGCVLSQLKPSEFYILSCEKVSAFGHDLFTAKNVELLGLHPIHKIDVYSYSHVSGRCYQKSLFLNMWKFKFMAFYGIFAIK